MKPQNDSEVIGLDYLVALALRKDGEPLKMLDLDKIARAFDTAAEILANGGELRLPCIGKLTTRDYGPRKLARNLPGKKGKKLFKIGPRKVLRVTASSVLKRCFKGGDRVRIDSGLVNSFELNRGHTRYRWPKQV